MNELTPLDGAALAIVIVGLLRGCWRGLINEGFSIAALGGCFITVRAFNPEAAGRLVEISNGQIGPLIAPWVSGALIVALTAGLIGLVGRWIRSGARAVGLGWADRVGGGVLGVAEGALVAALLVVASTWIAGEHPAVKESRSLEVLELAQNYVDEQGQELPAVGAGLED